LEREVGWLGEDRTAPGGCVALIWEREARAADSVFWKVTKEVRMAGMPVEGSRMPTATDSMEESHSFAACDKGASQNL